MKTKTGFGFRSGYGTVKTALETGTL